ncbi:unnamed protein product [Rhizophagus irregularis]|nr:unnamed protein product [Rhizophagus irregularis]
MAQETLKEVNAEIYNYCVNGLKRGKCRDLQSLVVIPVCDEPKYGKFAENFLDCQILPNPTGLVICLKFGRMDIIYLSLENNRTDLGLHFLG